MITYDRARELLREKREDISYFTEDFFDTYIKDRHAAIVKIGEPFEATSQTDFCKLNGGAYCEFLEIMNSSMPKFRFKYYANTRNGYQLVRNSEARFDNIEEARVVARQLQKVCGEDYVEVERC